jgi:DNA-binding transcriptional ArsR family regulator
MSRPLNTESVFRAIADPTRRRVVDLLRRGERPVAEVIESIRLRPPAASYHLRVLLAAGVVRQRRHGTQRIYSFDPRALGPAQLWLNECFGSPARERERERPRA